MVNPMQMMQFMQNPTSAMQQQILQRFKAQDPQKYQNIMAMVNGKDEAGIRQIVENVAKEKGVNLSDMAKQMGLKI